MADSHGGLRQDVESISGPHVYLHIGTMKSGTSYLQELLRRNADQLLADGVYYANRIPGTAQAIQEVVGPDGARSDLTTLWPGFVESARSTAAPKVVISNELLSFLDEQTAKAVVASLAPSRVTVIVTARDLVRVIPSAWQNKVKHGRGWSFPGFVRSIMEPMGDDPRGPQRSFWHHHDLTAILSRWVAAAGADNVVLLPVPPSSADPDALWRRFASVLGVDGAAYDSSQDQRSNVSIGYAETELLRRVNREIRNRVDKETHRRLVLQYLANEVLRPDPLLNHVPDRATLDPAAHQWAIERSLELVAGARGLGVHVVGDLDDLIPPPPSAGVDASESGDDATSESGVARAPDRGLSPEIIRAVVTLLLRIDELESGATVHPRRKKSGARRAEGEQIEVGSRDQQ